MIRPEGGGGVCEMKVWRMQKLLHGKCVTRGDTLKFNIVFVVIYRVDGRCRMLPLVELPRQDVVPTDLCDTAGPC